VEMPWTAPPIVGLGVIGVVLMGLLARQERRFADPLLPPRLFANPVFTRGVAIAFCGAMALFGGSFLLPLFFQLVMGVDAATSGTLVMPFLATHCAGAIIAGLLARRYGKMKAIVIAGIVGCLIGFVLLSLIDRTTPRFLLVVDQLVLGFGIGMVMPSSMVCVQNAVARGDIGAATGCLLLLRSMGGAFGSTLVGALLTKDFASRLIAFGITAHVNLADVHQHGRAIAGVPSAMLLHIQVALAGAFHIAFLACAMAMIPAVIAALGMRDLPLRTTSANEPAPLAH
jgi:MFS family permease